MQLYYGSYAGHVGPVVVAAVEVRHEPELVEGLGHAIVLAAKGAIALPVTLSGGKLLPGWEPLRFPSSSTVKVMLVVFRLGLRPDTLFGLDQATQLMTHTRLTRAGLSRREAGSQGFAKRTASTEGGRRSGADPQRKNPTSGRG